MMTHVPSAWEVAVGAWLIHCQTRLRHRPQTLYTRRQHLERTARHLGIPDPWAVTPECLLDYFGAQPWSDETRRAHRASLRSFYRWAVEVGHVEVSPALALPVVKPTDPNPQPVPDRVYAAALAEAPPRERLMLRLAAEHGLRRGEIALVHSRDVVEDLDGWSLIVHGKGGRERMVPLLDDVARSIRALGEGWAFPGRLDGHVSPRWVGKLIGTRLDGAWTIHKLRHRAATRWVDEDEGNIHLVAELLGHASVETTRRYARPNRKRMRRIVNRAA